MASVSHHKILHRQDRRDRPGPRGRPERLAHPERLARSALPVSWGHPVGRAHPELSVPLAGRVLPDRWDHLEGLAPQGR